MAKEARARSPEREPDPDFSKELADTGEDDRLDTADPVVDGTEPSVDEDERRTERRARQQGWVPQAEFRGDPAKWVSAADFLEKGYGNNDILRERIDKLADKLDQRDGQITELHNRVSESGQVLQSLNARFINADRAGYARGKADAEARMRQAVAEADPEAYDAAKADLDALDAAPPPAEVRQPAPQPARTEPARPAVDPVTQAWTEQPEHSWFNESARAPAGSKARKLSGAAVVLHKTIVDDNPGISQIDALNMVNTEIRRLFPENFENPRRSAPGAGGARQPSGDRGMNGNGAPRGGRTFANLPAEAKAEFKRTRTAMGPDKKTGKPYFTEEMFLEHYVWDN